MFSCATFTYFGAKWIDAETGPARKSRGRLVILVNFLVLFLFKYLDWARGNVATVGFYFGFSGPTPHFGWILPLGISFYLFESTSYFFDVIKKREKVHSFWDFQLFIAFFPKLIAGPIMRAKELLPQFEKPVTRLLSSARSWTECWLIISGMFMKVVLADGIAPESTRPSPGRIEASAPPTCG